MKKNNGFTLIELLAVIVILAIVALIATPIVLNVIDQSKYKAAISAVGGYADAIKLARIQYIFDNPDDTEPTWTELEPLTTVGGEKPTDCTVTVSNGVINLTDCKSNGHVCTYDTTAAQVLTCSKSGS